MVFAGPAGSMESLIHFLFFFLFVTKTAVFCYVLSGEGVGHHRRTDSRSTYAYAS